MGHDLWLVVNVSASSIEMGHDLWLVVNVSASSIEMGQDLWLVITLLFITLAVIWLVVTILFITLAVIWLVSCEVGLNIAGTVGVLWSSMVTVDNRPLL